MAGKKKGKKGKSQEEQPSGSQQQSSSGDQPQRGPQTQQPQGAPRAQQPEQGPPAQQQQRGPQGQPQHGHPRQQQGSQGQPQQGPPGPQLMQQGPQGQPQQGPPRQQQGPQGQQQPWGPPGHQQMQQGPPMHQQQAFQGEPQQRGQQPQRGRGRGRPQDMQRGSPSPYPQYVGQPQEFPQPSQYQQPQGPPGQQPHQGPQRGEQSQRGRGRGRPHQDMQRESPQPQYISQQQEFSQPSQYQQPQGPPGQQPHQGPQRGQQSQRGRGRGRPQQDMQRESPQPQYISQQQEFSQPSQPQYQQSQGPPGQQPHQGPQRGRGGGRGGQRGSPAPHAQQAGQPQESPQRQQPQQTSATARPSSSQPAPIEGLTSQVSEMQLSRIEAGQGDTQLGPIESKIPVKPGTKGRKILVEANHIPLNLGTLTSAIHYDVNLVPDLPKGLLRSVLEAFRRKHYNNRYPAFDGRKNLYSSKPLPFGDFVADEIVIQDSEGREKKFKVEIKFANKVDLTPLRDLLRPTETLREALQVVDIVLRSAPAQACIPVGRSFFVKPRTIIDLGEGMEMYNGFYQSAIRGWKPFLNVDVAHKAFPKNSNLLDVLPELFDSYYQPFKREDLARPLSRFQLDTLNNFIKSLKVCYEIPGHPATRRVYSVNGIDVAPRDKIFKLDSGEQTSIEKYFEKQKNYRLRYPHLPTLWVGARQRENKILLPLELCSLKEGQVIRRKMTENQTSKMIRHAATNTAVRKDKIMTALHQANHNADPTVREFGFSIGNEFEKLQARILQPPGLVYANQKTVQPSKGVWRGERFFAGVTINKWTIACVDRRPARPDDLSKFAEQIFRNGASSGMNITTQAEKPFDHISGSQSIQDIRKYFQTKKEKNYDVIFVIVPNSGPQYSFVKTAAEINVGCLTQCIKSKTLSKMNPQTAINILLKVNSKLNGTNHFLFNRPPIMSRPCMIMGADVTHPSPDAVNIPSVAAVTASHDPKAFQYNICWRLQPPKVEIIEDLEAIAVEQLRYFYSKTKVKPERIVFFRDGVSEGQFDQVRNAEIRAIRSACKKLQADGYEPSITFLVVQKRHHTRLFPTNPRDSEDRNMNVPAGTCVDTTITHPLMQDFYLVSHASIQGVAKPTKYCTLWDENSMNHDDIEELTYYLCHMFTRCNRSVSYPAPTYYAHLAAARAKVYIENERLNMDELQREFSRFQIQDVIRKGLPMFFV